VFKQTRRHQVLMRAENRRSITMCGGRQCCVIMLSMQGYRQGLRQSKPASLLTEGTYFAYQLAFDYAISPDRL